MYEYCSFETAIRRTSVQLEKKKTPSLALEGCQVGHTNRLKTRLSCDKRVSHHFQWNELWLTGWRGGGGLATGLSHRSACGYALPVFGILSLFKIGLDGTN